MSSFVLDNINTSDNTDQSIQSYTKLIELYHQNAHNTHENIEVSFAGWFSANMSSSLGGILDKLAANLNSIKIGNIADPNLQNILRKNNFLANYGFTPIEDCNSTTIEYLKLKPTDVRSFGEHVQYLLHKQELPVMSSSLKKKIAQSLYEIFANAKMHSQTDFIYTCGQFYPGKNKLEFTITDIGIGFKTAINGKLNQNFSADQAIWWATGNHTTKIGVPGGHGLVLLQEFAKKNSGKIQIVSDAGFYQCTADGYYASSLPLPFPGSIVNVQFRTDDNNSYSLTSEESQHNLF